IGFGLLLYVGLSMGIPALKKGKEDEAVNLSGAGHLLMAAAATSIDALAVGASLAMAEWPLTDIFWVHIAVFAVTVLASSAGILSGSAIGRRFGRPAQFVGGLVLIGLGVSILLG
ncbi:MAG: manganese efflux pump MntP family protein, partial [Candidatus Cryptobacteroides sp.]